MLDLGDGEYGKSKGVMALMKGHTNMMAYLVVPLHPHNNS